MAHLSDEALRALLIEHPRRGWRAFVDQYTPLLLAQVEWAGVSGRDDVADVYVRVCERLAENDCARLRRHDPRKGSLAAWLTIVVRHAAIDWLRSRTGRRRLYPAIRRLDAFDRRVFELHFWEQRRPTEIAELLSGQTNREVALADVLEALGRIHQALSDRQRSQLAALVSRMHPAAALEEDVPAESVMKPAAPRIDPERALSVKELDRAFSAALAALPREDAAIIRMMFLHGWSREEVRRALRLDRLTQGRIKGILEALRSLLGARGIQSAEAVGAELTFLDRSST